MDEYNSIEAVSDKIKSNLNRIKVQKTEYGMIHKNRILLNWIIT